MALPTQLKAARMTNATPVSQVDDKAGEGELALCDILGFTPDVDVTESPTSFDNSGRFTKALLRLKAAGPVGWRFLDSTSGKEFRLVLSGSSILIDENTGTEGTPVWTNRWTMPIGGVPAVKVSREQSIPDATATAASWTDADATEYFDTDSMHEGVTNPTRITIATAGVYQVTASATFAADADGSRTINIRKNGTTQVSQGMTLSPHASISTSVVLSEPIKLAASDYVELMVEQNSGGALNTVLSLSAVLVAKG